MHCISMTMTSKIQDLVRSKGETALGGRQLWLGVGVRGRVCIHACIHTYVHTDKDTYMQAHAHMPWI